MKVAAAAPAVRTKSRRVKVVCFFIIKASDSFVAQAGRALFLKTVFGPTHPGASTGPASQECGQNKTREIARQGRFCSLRSILTKSESATY